MKMKWQLWWLVRTTQWEVARAILPLLWGLAGDEDAVNAVIERKMKKGTLWGWHRVEERFPVRGNSYILGWSKSLFRFFHNPFLNICEYQEKMPVEKRRVWSHQEEKQETEQQNGNELKIEGGKLSLGKT